MPTDKESYDIKYGAAAQFGSAGGVLGMLGGLMGGSKNPTPPSPEETQETQEESPAPFKLRSGNTTPFKMMGSSPAKFFGNVFGGGGGGMLGGIFGRRRGGGGGGFQPENLFARHTKQWWDRQNEIRQKRAELRSQGLDPNQEKNWATTGPTGGGGGGDGAHTHGTGGEPIGGTDVAAAESPAAPVDEEMVA